MPKAREKELLLAFGEEFLKGLGVAGLGRLHQWQSAACAVCRFSCSVWVVRGRREFFEGFAGLVAVSSGVISSVKFKFGPPSAAVWRAGPHQTRLEPFLQDIRCFWHRMCAYIGYNSGKRPVFGLEKAGKRTL